MSGDVMCSYPDQSMMLAHFEDHLITDFFECLCIIKCFISVFDCLFNLYVDKILAKLRVKRWEIHKTMKNSLFWKKNRYIMTGEN